MSDRSKSTAPTIHSDDLPTTSKRQHARDDAVDISDGRESVTTYTSTLASDDDFQDDDYDGPIYAVVDRGCDSYPCEAIPSNPTTFADLFPSPRRLLIRHDDSTIDGNMNLRVDTSVPSRKGGGRRDVTLFHLRMYDLYSRKFSLRRYCRDSGREVCHSERKRVSSKPDPWNRSSRSWSSVLAGLRPGSKGHDGSSSTAAYARRMSAASPSSGKGVNSWIDGEKYIFDEDDHNDDDRVTASSSSLTETTQLEFSNYAHVEVKRRGTGSFGRFYEYEYWSTKFRWVRESRRDGDLRQASYHLINTRTAEIVAYIVPDILTPLEEVEEQSKGGWIPPCSMWISDPSVYRKMHDMAE